MKTKILLLLTVAAFLSSCGSNSNQSINVTTQDIIGTWNVTEQTIEATTSTTFQGFPVVLNTTGYGKDFNFTIIFSGSPNIVSSQGTFTTVTTTIIPGQPDLVQETPITSLDGFGSGSWSLNENIITVVDASGESSDGEIVEFTSTMLKIKLVVNDVQDINGVSADISGETILTLEK